MTVYFDKARKRWRYHFERRKRRYSGYCLDSNDAPVTSRSAAREAEAIEKRRADIAPKVARATDLTLGMIASALTPKLQMQAQWSNKHRYLREIISYFGPETPMSSIGQNNVDDYITHAQSQPLKIWKGGPNRDPSDQANARFWIDTGKLRSAATVNRYLPMLRELFSRAYDTRDPLTGERAIAELPRIVDLSEPKRRARPIPDEVLSKVIASLPAHVTDALIASLYFGFRRSEIFHLEISDVDFERGGVWLSAAKVKDHEDAFLPGAPVAMEHMRKLVDQTKARGLTRLISWRRHRKDEKDQAEEPWRTIESPKTAWATAMNVIEGEFGRRWRWHDIRAAYITQVAKTAGPMAAQALARHSDFRTTQDYIGLSDQDMRDGADMAALRPSLALLKGGKT